MKTVLSDRSHAYRRAPCPFLCGVLALVSICASSAIAQPGPALVQRLDSIAGAGVRENRAVGIGVLSKEWTPIEKNTLLIGIQGSMLANRILWIGIGLGVLVFTYLRFRFGDPAA